LAFLGVVGALLTLPCPWGPCAGVCWVPTSTFNGYLGVDGLSIYFKSVILLGTLFTLVMAFRYFESKQVRHRAEFLAILLFSAAGATSLAGSREIITLYVSLETLTISSFLLAAFLKKEKGSNEAGLKYLLMGAFSSALLLFGLSYLYGLTGTTMIAEMAKRLADQPASAIEVLAVILVVAGLSFKISLAPFHMWTPDVYEGAPTPVTAYLSVVSKTAGFAAFTRIFWGGLAAPAILPVWVGLFGVLAALSMVLGNLEALPQTNLKRLLGYSSIAQAGYLAVGFLAGGELGMTALLFYLVAYLFANLSLFLVVGLVAARTGGERIVDFAGLWKRAPFLGLTLAVGLFSLAGLPPFAGFAGKWYLFSAAVAKGYLWLALIGVLFSAVSLYYYLQIVRQALLADPADASPIPVSWLEKAFLGLSVAALILFGVWPTPIAQAAQAAAATLF
ncbi:MAG TPA: NADH-quinone oxidoreductase subunit N, partial [bacterium]|nr:NADH-quinone oxidoreductase subunit N [bacterium]